MSTLARSYRPPATGRTHPPPRQTSVILRFRRDCASNHDRPWPSAPVPRPDLALSSSRADLWLLFESDVEDGSELTRRYRAVLTEAEHDRERAFHFARDRHRYILTRALVRCVLSRYAPIAASDWRFAPDRYGRPLIVNDHESLRGLSFNISHSDGLIVLAITCLHAVGVDVETILREAPDDVASRYFSASEFAALKALPEGLKHRRFFDLWTLKESYIKARGIGLSIPLNKFSFDLDGDPRIVRFDEDFDDVPERWTFCQLLLSRRHSAALCLQHAGGGTPTLTSRKVVPLTSEQTLNFQLDA